jgi:hypothetical protein
LVERCSNGRRISRRRVLLPAARERQARHGRSGRRRRRRRRRRRIRRS